MSVINHEVSGDFSALIRSAVLEDILRDAACFAPEDDAPGGLAHRALARHIAGQSAQKYLTPVRVNRKQTVALWFGGLSAGTLAGAAAAILVIAHLNGSAFRITPETASLSAPALSELSALPTSRENSVASPTLAEPLSGTNNWPGASQAKANAGKPATIVATAAVKASFPEIRLPAHHSAENNVPSRSAEWRWTKEKEQDLPPSPRARSAAYRTSSVAKTHSAPPVAQWKTEPFEETEYQLVTAAYTPEPTSGGYVSGRDHLQLTPLKMRASLDQPEADPNAGPSLPQY